MVGGKITQEHSRTAQERFLKLSGTFHFGRLGTRRMPETPKPDKIWNFGAKFSTLKIRILRHLRHQSAAFFLKNSKMAIRNYEEWVRHVKMPQNLVFCIDFRWPLYFLISTPRRGASHHVSLYVQCLSRKRCSCLLINLQSVVWRWMRHLQNRNSRIVPKPKLFRKQTNRF